MSRGTLITKGGGSPFTLVPTAVKAEEIGEEKEVPGAFTSDVKAQCSQSPADMSRLSRTCNSCVSGKQKPLLSRRSSLMVLHSLRRVTYRHMHRL